MEARQTEQAGKKVTRELVKALTVAFNDHDVDAIMEFFADDCEWIMARGPEQPHGPYMSHNPRHTNPCKGGGVCEQVSTLSLIRPRTKPLSCR